MKKIFIFLFFIISLFLVGCNNEKTKEVEDKNNEPKEETLVVPKETDPIKTPVETELVTPTPVVTPIVDTPTPIVTPTVEVTPPFMNGEGYKTMKAQSYLQLYFSIKDYPGYEYVYDKDCISMKINYENSGYDFVFAKIKGLHNLSVVKDGVITSIYQIKVIDKKDVTDVNFHKTMYVGDELNIEISEDVFISFDNDLLSYDFDTKTLKANGVGYTTITLQSQIFLEITKEYQVHIIERVVDAEEILVKKGNYTEGEEVLINGLRYYYGTTLFNKISDALNNNNVIYIDSTDEKSVTINKDNVELIGCSDNELDLSINVLENVTGLIISNMHFTLSSKISFTGGNKNINISNNTFSNTTVNTTTWVATNKYTDGIITFSNSDNYYDDILIENNTFTNIGDCGINASTMHDFKAINNTFDGFNKDAIRMNNGIVREECTWLFTDNSFSNGEYSGIYFRTYASDTVDFYHYVTITNNSFNNVGNNGGEYVGAILFRNYQEGCVSVDIRYNTFKNCKKFIFLRNNAIAAHQVNFTGFVGYNTFETIPSNYYFNNLNNSDTNTLNPKQAILKDNVYLDGNGNDITPSTSKIIGAKESTVITKGALESLGVIKVPYLMLVGKSYDINPYVGSAEFFNKTDNYVTPVKEGIYKLYNGSIEFDCKCVAQIELVVRFINIALGEVGYEEMDANGKTGTSGNYTKYGEWYGINPGAWCAMFVSWCANQAGVSTSVIPKYASVQIGMDWYKDKGLFQYKESYTPKAGDIMFMKSNGASHTGIVLYCDGKTLYTVEGNTSDTCACRKYDVNNAKITGYGTPQWSYYSPDGYDFSSGEPQDGSSHSTT